jgi:hypothetical protein
MDKKVKKTKNKEIDKSTDRNDKQRGKGNEK